ncbi:MAG: transcription-repair coupling factor [Armatimonadetes bacterium]|nr:transcription-repair coupling factor [Armatimonadota bacterium]
MRVAEWARRLTELNPEPFENQSGAACWSSLPPEARAVFVASAYLQFKQKMLVVTGSYDRALAWQAKLELCGVPHGEIFQLPSGSSALFEDATPEHTALSDRLGALRALAEEGPKIVIASPQAALERTLPRDLLLESFLTLKPNETADPLKVTESLKRLGYEEQEPVRQPGGYSQRGGIVDVWPSGYEQPIRIEWFDTEIESIRTFDSNTQRSTGVIPALGLSPSREVLFTGQEEELQQMILQTLTREEAQLDDDIAANLREIIEGDAQALAHHQFFDRLELYRPLLFPDSECAVDFVGDDGLLVLDEPLEIEAIGNRAESELSQALEARVKRGEILHSTANDFFLPVEHLDSTPNKLSLTSMNDLPRWLTAQSTSDLGGASLEPYRGRADAFTQTLKTWREQGFTLVFTTDQPNRAKTVLSQIDIHPVEDGEGQDFLSLGNIGGGFVLPHQKIAFISDAELFGVARLKLPQRRFQEGAPITTVLDLKPGDYVVHINFGIGIFRGLIKKEVEGVEKEFLYVEYQAPDKLYVPADQLDRIQKYLNPGDVPPKLNRLTGGEWQRTLGKAKEEARAFARDLVKLYAVRKKVERTPYGLDTPFQSEMEQTFPWVETPSQLRAIQESKADLELPYPMDRLVCGDVGFGKTEVAIRVAFKAIQSGRQVAVLCPTTILSEQHFRNFDERLGSFGTKLALINRYTHASNRREILDGLKDGDVEIVIGTHALLGTGIEFRHLGLVIIDEEQKFGVKQKEMLKQLRSEVDVLTLSATPIPRTLSMALMDIRQMSLINDPPPGRLPVRTFVRPYAGEVVREAILRELARGGQVFYVYNRVDSINHVYEKLRKLVPTARIGIGHGQMNERELEPIMVGFIKGEIDILLCTTIVESGLDIPNANTIIIENADRLGLAQLYQLRGRVGRSDRQAYALFLYNRAIDETVKSSKEVQEEAYGLKKKKKTMSENALARLRALQEFSSLGSGYSLAFRDLQIRGAGELLGAKQSGTMVQVGYELYTQLINEAVSALKNSVDGEPVTAETSKDPLESLTPLPPFEVPVIALLPDTYIKDHSQRLYYYQQMMSARDHGKLGEVQKEIEDRYGRAPQTVSNAFAIMALRITGHSLGIEKLDARQGRIACQFKTSADVPPRLFTMITKYNKAAYLTREAFIWPFTTPPIETIDEMFRAIQACMEEIERHRQLINN